LFFSVKILPSIHRKKVIWKRNISQQLQAGSFLQHVVQLLKIFEMFGNTEQQFGWY